MSTALVSLLNSFSSDAYSKLKVWVLAPHLESKDKNIDYYYDFSQSIEEYSRVFKALAINWKWQPINLVNQKIIIADIANEKKLGHCFPIVINLCDGDEINGTPGISIIKSLIENELIFTGADEYFYNITTSKIPMKKSFDEAGVTNAKWMPIYSSAINTKDVFDYLGTPIIIKPAVSGGSMGVGIKNVVETEEELRLLLNDLFEGYHGWNLTTDGLIAERFIVGPEFTSFVCGYYDKPTEAKVFMPVERVFHPSLPEKERFLSFDRLWEIYEKETSMPNEENFYEYQIPNSNLIDSIKKLSWDAFVANKGTGYTRVDIRMDASSQKLFVLETNAQCGISEDENFTSIGAILKFSDVTFTQLIEAILINAINRYKDGFKLNS